MKIDPRRALAGITAAFALLSLSPAASAQAMPALPDAIKSQGKVRVGVRCDQPPYGFQDEKGQFAGVEVDMAKQIATYAFGSPDKAELTCVTAANRIPQLTSKRVDLLIATLGISPERARVVAFSKPYRWGASDVLVAKDSPYKKLDDLSGKTIIALTGSVQAKWFEEKMKSATLLRLNTAADSLQALKQGRGEAYAHDAATLVIIASKDPTLRLLGDHYQLSDAAMAVRPGEDAWLAYVDAAIVRMRSEGLFLRWVEKWVPADVRSYYVMVFKEPRPAER
ncbi:MAG TPA: transporter substrate-binding domain-containing protein [Usitatibacter sp.]|nr:transporter substrate-binding domain-containing protein [Usitatibacter sp.]